MNNMSYKRASKKTIIPIAKTNELSKHGYRDVKNKTVAQRHRSLKRAVTRKNSLRVFRRLLALSTLHKRTNKRLSKTFREDAKWIQTQNEYKKRK